MPHVKFQPAPGAWPGTENCSPVMPPPAGAGLVAFRPPAVGGRFSGTTGLPEPIVLGHGGIVLEAMKGGLHDDVFPSVETGDRSFWFSSTGWIC